MSILRAFIVRITGIGIVTGSLVSIAVAVRAVQAATLRIVNQTGGPPELARPGSPPRLAARFVHQGCKIVAITFRQHERTIATVDGIVAHLARDGAVPEAT